MITKKRREREKKKREEQIINAAEKLVFEKGIKQTSVDEIAKEAELSKGTLYLYFKNKDDLFHAVIFRGLKILLNKFVSASQKEAKGIDNLVAIGEAYFEFAEEHPKYFKILMHEEMHDHSEKTINENPFIKRSEQISVEIFETIISVIQKGLDDGSIKYDKKPINLAVTLWAHTTGIMNIVRTKGFIFKKQFGINPQELYFASIELAKRAIEDKNQEYK